MAGKMRAPHKEGCRCAVCKSKRGVVEPMVLPSIEPEVPEVIVKLEETTPPPLSPPADVRLDSLPSTAKFILGGQEYRVGQKVEGMVVCYNLAINDTVTIGGLTMVRPI